MNGTVENFNFVCARDELWEGEMTLFQVDRREVLFIGLGESEFRAIQPTCPHQSQPLVDGTLEETILKCRWHLWQFDIATGRGVNPANSQLVQYPVKVHDDGVYVDVDRMSTCVSHDEC